MKIKYLKNNCLLCVFTIIGLFVFSTIRAQDYRLKLYTDNIPYSKPNTYVESMKLTNLALIFDVVDPDIAVYLPNKKNATGKAVIICPGGGYGQLSYDLEGTEIAYFLNSIGVAGIVLKYRLPNPSISSQSHLAPLNDAQRALRLVRYKASEWNINPSKIGIMGFSAGGHVASSLGTHFDTGNPSATDIVEKQSCRPDFMVLMYPVISMADSITHQGSKSALLYGGFDTPQWVKYFSNELQVTSNTPPTFLVHAADDNVVSPKNSFYFYRSLLYKGVRSELHIISEGGHGFGMAFGSEHVSEWTTDLKNWLKNL